MLARSSPNVVLATAPPTVAVRYAAYRRNPAPTSARAARAVPRALPGPEARCEPGSCPLNGGGTGSARQREQVAGQRLDQAVGDQRVQAARRADRRRAARCPGRRRPGRRGERRPRRRAAPPSACRGPAGRCPRQAWPRARRPVVTPAARGRASGTAALIGQVPQRGALRGADQRAQLHHRDGPAGRPRRRRPAAAPRRAGLAPRSGPAPALLAPARRGRAPAARWCPAPACR